jgi:hypothetical protein
MVEIEWLVFASLLMGGAEGFGSSPRFEGGAAFPHRVGCIESVVLGRGAFEEVEFDKSRHGIKIGIARPPHAFEGGFASSDDPESVHGNEHGLHLTLLAPGFNSGKREWLAIILCLAIAPARGVKNTK